MELLLLCLNAVLPLFLIVAAGYLAKRLGWIREEDVPRINAAVFRVFLPVMCFYNVYASELSAAIRPRMMLFFILGTLAVFALSFLYASARVPEPQRRGVVVQGLYRSNFLIIGLSFASGLIGEDSLGVVALMGAVVAPLFNILAVVALEYCRGGRAQVGTLLLDIVKNPLILGTAAGVLCLLTGFRLPGPVELAARDMSRAASPITLFLLGAFFRISGASAHRRELIAACAGRLVLIPAVMLPLSALMGFRGVEFVTLLAAFSSSTAVASFTMAEQMGGDAALAGDIVVVTSALCPLTLFLWSMLFGSLGMF